MLDLDHCEQLLSRLPIQHIIGGEMVPFKFNYNQWLLKERIKAHQKKIGGKIRVVVPKARRVGISSFSTGLQVCHIAERSNATAWIVACLDNTAKELFRVPTDLINSWPWPLPPPLTTKITYPHKEGDSYLTLATAKSVISGRGPTLSSLLLSEAAYYPSGNSFMALLPSVSEDPGTMIIVESTCNGKTGQGESFWNMWDAAVRGDSEYLGIFLTWLDDLNCRRDPEGFDFVDRDSDERAIIVMMACDSQCGRCEKCHTALQCLSWRKWAIQNKCEGKVEIFHQEYPINADEAFYSSSFPAFTKEEMAIARQTVKEPISIGRLEIDKDSFGTTGTNEPRFHEDSNALLRVWQFPVKDYHYYMGADAARGMGGDYTAVNVWCGQTGEQVARYAHKRTDPDSLARLLFLLGTWYNYAMANIELTGNLGLWAQKVLRDQWEYRNIYRWKGRDDKTPGPRPFGSIGWETNVRTRDMMLSAFRSGIAHKKCIVRDAALVMQMEAAEMLDGRWTVPDEIHDDIFVSAMIGWVAKEQWHSIHLGTVAPRSLLGEDVGSTVDPVDEAKREVRGAKGDVDAAVQAHWARLRRIMNIQKEVSNQFSESAKPGVGPRAANRLEGI